MPPPALPAPPHPGVALALAGRLQGEKKTSFTSAHFETFLTCPSCCIYVLEGVLAREPGGGSVQYAECDCMAPTRRLMRQSKRARPKISNVGK